MQKGLFTFERLLWLHVTSNTSGLIVYPVNSDSITIYVQQKTHVTAEAKNPASCVTAGIARIPAPTYGINVDEKEG